MKKMVYVIIGVMFLVGLFNVSAMGKESKLEIYSAQGVVVIDPVY